MIGKFPADVIPSMPRSGRRPLPAALRPLLVTDDTGLFQAVRYLPYKRFVDCVLGVAFGILLFPFLLLTFVVMKVVSPGPFFYTQTRLGRFGKPFVIWKIRTMRHNCETTSGAIWSTKGDSRVTPVGRVLRKLHIDEFPQLWNVLKGDMSLVGPRPERPEFFPVLEATVADYPKRLLVKPGVTGLAQSYLPPDEDIESVRLKQIHDLHYIRTMSLWLDLRLMLITAIQVLGVPHGLARQISLLPNPKVILHPDAIPQPALAKTPVPG